MIRTLCLFVLLSSLVPTSVWAQQDAAELRYQAAVRLFGEGRYRESLAEFDAAIALDPQSVFFCNKALVELKLQETGRALESLRECRQRFEGDENELASIDAQLLGVSTYHEVVRIRAMTVARDIAAGPVALNPIDGDPNAWDMGDTGFVFLGLSAALVASAITVDILSADLKSDFLRESEGGPGTSLERYEVLRDDLSFRQTIFYSLGIGGAASAAAGVVLLILHYSDSDEQAWIPVIAPGRVGIQTSF